MGVFGIGQGATSPSDVAMIRNSVVAFSDNGTLSCTVVMKIEQTEDLNIIASDFVNQLVK